jgi:hypothetical protein
MWFINYFFIFHNMFLIFFSYHTWHSVELFQSVMFSKGYLVVIFLRELKATDHFHLLFLEVIF